MPTITVGTNSYVTLAEADTYFEGRAFAKEWAETSLADKTLYILSALSYLENGFVWNWDKSDEDQVLEWPRNSGTIVPGAIKAAQYEIALLLLKTGGDLIEPEESIKVDKVTFEFSNKGLFPANISNLLSQYGSQKIQANPIECVSVIRS